MRFKAMLALVLGLMTGAAPAHATLIEADWLAAGDRLITVDTETGLSWLDIPVTAGKSVVKVLELLRSDSRYADFRYATSPELLKLAEHAGMPVRDGHAVPENFAPALFLIGLVGRTIDEPLLIATLGLVEDAAFNPDLWPVDIVSARPDRADGSIVIETAYFPPGGANSTVGSWLVAPRGNWQVPTVTVAMPAPLFLIGLGLFLLGFRGRFASRQIVKQ